MLGGILFVEKCRLCLRTVELYGKDDPHCLCQKCWTELRSKALKQTSRTAMFLRNETKRVTIPILTPLIYEGDCQKLLRSLKYSGDKLIARIFGLLLRDLYNKYCAEQEIKAGPVLFGKSQGLIPIPLHWTRLWLRGYNQAEALARELSAGTELKVIKNGLRRVRRTPALANLDRDMRAQVVKDVFNAEKKRLQGQHIILVDDVVTSGATARACTQAILAAGAESCLLLAAARTPLK